MGGSKIVLSEAEQELMQDASLILTKNRVMEQVRAFMAELAEDFQTWSASYPALNEYLVLNPKISRGENYEGLPWVTLDYPRWSLGEELFFIRTMFWWGNHFSSTLQLNLPLMHKIGTSPGTYICVNDDQWLHHFREDNYRSLEDDELPRAQKFLKLAKRFPLNHWEKAGKDLTESWLTWMALVTQAVK